MNPSQSAEKVWFITGASRGFGRIWASAALERGDKVAVSARDVSSLQLLVEKYGDAVLTLHLDVTDREGVSQAVTTVSEHFGRVDIVLSNAGYGHQGAVEEISEAEARAQMDTNFFGTMWLAQASMPIFRAQGFGHLLAVSSVLGVFSAPPLGSTAHPSSRWKGCLKHCPRKPVSLVSALRLSNQRAMQQTLTTLPLPSIQKLSQPISLYVMP